MLTNLLERTAMSHRADTIPAPPAHLWLLWSQDLRAWLPCLQELASPAALMTWTTQEGAWQTAHAMHKHFGFTCVPIQVY